MHFRRILNKSINISCTVRPAAGAKDNLNPQNNLLFSYMFDECFFIYLRKLDNQLFTSSHPHPERELSGNTVAGGYSRGLERAVLERQLSGDTAGGGYSRRL